MKYSALGVDLKKRRMTPLTAAFLITQSGFWPNSGTLKCGDYRIEVTDDTLDEAIGVQTFKVTCKNKVSKKNILTA